MWPSLCTALLLLWPLPEPQVERLFDPPPRPWAAGHRGADLAGAVGQEVRAPGPGVVAFAGSVAGKGVVSLVLEDSGKPPLRSTFESVLPEVAVGDRVRAGQVLGRLRDGGGHCGAQVCLHWGLRRGERYLDPLLLMRPARPVLLPVPSAEPLPATGKKERISGRDEGETASQRDEEEPCAEPSCVEAPGRAESEGSAVLTSSTRRVGQDTVMLSLFAAFALVAGAGWARRRLSTPPRPAALRRFHLCRPSVVKQATAVKRSATRGARRVRHGAPSPPLPP